MTAQRIEELVRGLSAGRAAPVSGVLFDLDGTLVDSIPAVEESWRLWSAEHGVPTPSRAMHGLTAHAIVEVSGVPVAEQPEAERRLEQLEARAGQNLDTRPGVAQLIGTLPEGRWGIVTSAAPRVARARLRAAGITPPDLLVTSDDVRRGKPDPEPFARGLAGLGLRGDDVAVAIEDTVAGLRSARSAGCLAIGVVGTDTAAELSAAAHLVVPSLERLRVLEGDFGRTFPLALSPGALAKTLLM